MYSEVIFDAPLAGFLFATITILIILFEYYKKAFYTVLDKANGRTASDKDETKEIKWIGQTAFEVILKKYFYTLAGAWICSFITLYIADLTSYHNRTFTIFNITLILMSSCLLILFLEYLELKAAHKLRYGVSDKMIWWKMGNRYEELLFSKIKRHEIKKTFFDVSQFKTGSLHFFDEADENPRIKFEHIPYVDNISQIIQLTRISKEENLDSQKKNHSNMDLD